MGAVASLSRGATVCALDVALVGIFLFGLLFLVGWVAEETTKEHRWNKYRTLFIVMAIGGVAGEWIADIADFMLSEHLQAISDKEVAKLKLDAQQLATDEATARKSIAEAQGDASNARAAAAQAESHLADANARAAEANAKAEQFRLTIAQAQSQAAEALKEAEADHLARVQLEAKMAWRHLTAKQRAELPTLLAPLRGVAVVMSAQASDSEATTFAKEIEATLHDAGIKVDERFGLIMSSSGALPSGIAIEVTPDDRSKVEGGVLQRALQSEGISAPGLLLPIPPAEKDKPPNRTVELFVGARPE